MKEPIFVTLDKAAQILKVNKRHIKRMIQAGKLRAKDISLGTGRRQILRVLYEDLVKI